MLFGGEGGDKNEREVGVLYRLRVRSAGGKGKKEDRKKRILCGPPRYDLV